MNRKDYKRLMDQIEPDEGLEHQIVQKLKHTSDNINLNKGRGRSEMKRVVNAAAGLAVMVCLGLVIALTWDSANKEVATPIQSPDEDQAQTVVVNKKNDPNAVAIPKIELPSGELGAVADMVGLIVYKGNVYTQTGTSITSEIAKQLRGDQLGRTEAGIDEWSTKSDYTEMASNIGEMDVFSVKGYDEDFRIMSYLEMDGQIFAELYEHLNGITVSKGEDLIGKLNLKDHIESVKWQEFNSWNNSEMKFKDLQADEGLQQFISALYEAKPVAGDKLYKEGIYETAPENQKFIYLKLQDQTEVQLRLFKEGNYVSYASAPVFFQLDSADFDAFWEQMK